MFESLSVYFSFLPLPCPSPFPFPFPSLIKENRSTCWHGMCMDLTSGYVVQSNSYNQSKAKSNYMRCHGMINEDCNILASTRYTTLLSHCTLIHYIQITSNLSTRLYLLQENLWGGRGQGGVTSQICYWEGPIWAENTVQGTKNYFGNIGPRALYKLLVVESSILVIACGL